MVIILAFPSVCEASDQVFGGAIILASLRLCYATDKAVEGKNKSEELPSNQH